jgi:WD40 repeat protein
MITAVPFGTVTLFDPATLEEIEQLPALGAEVTGLAFSPDETLLAAASGRKNGIVRVWSGAERRVQAELDDPEVEVPVYLVCFRADGRQLFSMDALGRTTWWDTLTWQPVVAFRVGMLASSAALSPDGRLLAVGTSTGSVCWLKAETGEVRATLDTAHRLPVERIAFSQDGTQAASVADDGTVAIWNTSSLQLIDAFQGHMHAAFGVAFSPDGRRLVTGHGGREAVKLWDLSTGGVLLTFPGQGRQVPFVGFSPDGRWLTACDGKGELFLWQAPSWEEMAAAEGGPESKSSP